MKLDRGDLNRLTTLEMRSTSLNSHMEEIEDFTFHKKAWAAINHKNAYSGSNEMDGAGKELNKNEIAFTYSYESVKSIYKAMPKNYRIVYDGTPYDILGYQEEGFRDYITFISRHAS